MSPDGAAALDPIDLDEGPPAKEKRRVGPRRELVLGERVVLLELQTSYGYRFGDDRLVLSHRWNSPKGRVTDPPTLECPFVTVLFDNGELATLHKGNVRRTGETETYAENLVRAMREEDARALRAKP